jgi:hypothetical protein
MSSCTDHLIASFLEHFPTFPNSFLVGGAADYFVIELTDQVYSLYEIFNVTCYVLKCVLVNPAPKAKSGASTSALPFPNDHPSRYFQNIFV